MLIRLAVIVAGAAFFFALSHGSITVPALTLLGLIAWAVAASVAALILWRRTHSTSPPEGK
jgi:hypothetical protein